MQTSTQAREILDFVERKREELFKMHYLGMTTGLEPRERVESFETESVLRAFRAIEAKCREIIGAVDSGWY